MHKQNRREFIKNCGIGMGAVAASGLWLNQLFSGCSPQTGGGLISDIFNISKEDIQKLLLIALSKGGEFSELYFEYTLQNAVTMSEDIVKSSSESIQLGVGVRVIKGEQTGYGYTSNLSFDKIKHAALTAATIASGNSKDMIINLTETKPQRQVYDLKQPISEEKLPSRIDLITRAYNSAKSFDSRIIKVSASVVDDIQKILLANSEGLLVADTRPQARLTVVSTAEDKGNRTTGYYNAGGRIGMNFYQTEHTPESIGERASEEAIILLSAESATPGEQPVVLGKNQSGVMIHEAVGHPLEADGAWKKTSIMWDRVGQPVANPIVTIYDDATIPYYRGSMNIDDEGTPTQNVVLIEKGKLVGFLNDRLSAKILKEKPNGHGRRQSYKFPPIPRMNNTVLGKGDYKPEEIISSVKKGFYAQSYEGGQVSGTGKFTFSVNLGYMIENGKLTKPLKNATLIGTNIQILKEVEMIADDTAFFLGTCGKEGQAAPVTAGTPTLKLRKMTVGGRA